MIASETNNVTTLKMPPRGGGSLKLAEHYSAYGLHVASELPLPEFTLKPDATGQPDVMVRFGSGEDWIPAVREQNSSWHVDTSDARFWFRGVGGFRILSGREIVIS